MNEPKLPDYWTDVRKELRSWFGRNAPSLGELYEGALFMLYSDSFPGRVRFVAHAGREIGNRLPDAIAGPEAKKGQMNYVNSFDDLAAKWQRAGFPIDGSKPVNVISKDELPGTGDIPIPSALYSKIAKLIEKHLTTRKKSPDLAKRLFQAIDQKNGNSGAALKPRITQWLECTKWFVGRAHDNGSTDERTDSQELLRQFEIFETTLSALVRGFFETLEELDGILDEANS